MGQSTNGILAYGYDLGGEEGGWKVREAGEYGELTLPWLPDPEAEEDYDLEELLERRLLDASGFTETYEDGREGYFGRESAAKAALGVELESYCMGDYPMYVLATKVLTAYRGDCDVIDMAELSRPEILAGWDTKLSAALAALGMTPVQEKPAWLLCSYWA
jgi:hypothetical protein